jgi:hypothetical protein
MRHGQTQSAAWTLLGRTETPQSIMTNHQQSNTRTAEQFLSQAVDLLIERGKQYDKPGGERSMGSTVKAFNAITNKTLSESEGWLFMSILKRVRQFQGPYHKDSAEDAVSYSALEAEALERGL